MNQKLLSLPQWRPFFLPRPSTPPLPCLPLTRGGELTHGGELTAKQRRQLRNEKRNLGGLTNWREEVEDRLLIKPKKETKSWKEQLNLDNVSLLGSQWWALRTYKISSHYTAQFLERTLPKNFPGLEFKVFYPGAMEKRRLKDGSVSVKPKAHMPCCILLKCVLDKRLHDFIKGVDGVGGFQGFQVGKTQRQINRPKPVPNDEIERLFQQVKEAQENFDQIFEKEQQQLKMNVNKSTTDAKPKKGSRKNSEQQSLAPGSMVRILSGPFAESTGYVKKLDHTSGKATVGFMLFGNESFADIEVEQIVAETA